MYRLHGAIHAYGGTTVSARDTADSVITALSPAAWYRNATDVVSSGGFASIWADYASSDVGLVLPGVAGNYASTTDSVPLSITGDIDIIARVSPADWTPAAINGLVCKDNGVSPRAYSFYLSTTGALAFFFDNGAGGTATTESSAATGFTDGTAHWVRVTRAASTGACNFYTANDSSTVPASWTQLGTADRAGAAGALADTTIKLDIGTLVTLVFNGIFYRAIVKDGIDGTTVFDADFSAQSIGAGSFTESSSNAATVTINTSGALPAHIGKARDYLQGTGTNQPAYDSGTGAVSCDGADNFLETLAVATMVQPLTRITVLSQDTWTLNDYLYDGRAANSGAVYQSATTPDLVGNAGSAMTANGDAPVGAKVILVSQWDGANSFTRVNNNANVASASGAGNPLGLTLGASGTPGGYGDMTAYEEVVYESALSEANINSIVTALANVHSVTL